MKTTLTLEEILQTVRMIAEGISLHKEKEPDDKQGIATLKGCLETALEMAHTKIEEITND